MTILDRREAIRVGACLLVFAVVGSIATLAHAADCTSTNGSLDPDCTVPHTYVPLPAPVPIFNWTRVEVSPINVGGPVDCSGYCGYLGTGPIAVGGDSNCSAPNGGCGSLGTGPIAVGGDSSCSAPNGGGCGNLGTGPIAVGGDSSCSGADGCGGFLGTGPIAVGGDSSCNSRNGGCGYYGTGPIAVGGDSSCNSPNGGCGFYGTGSIATGDVSCHGACGRTGPLCFILDCLTLPRSGSPGVSVAGHAYCDEPLNAAKATNPGTAVNHLENFGCASARDVAGL